jgi:hypothetical protein
MLCQRENKIQNVSSDYIFLRSLLRRIFQAYKYYSILIDITTLKKKLFIIVEKLLQKI